MVGSCDVAPHYFLGKEFIYVLSLYVYPSTSVFVTQRWYADISYLLMAYHVMKLCAFHQLVDDYNEI